jgi:hypothetical protein
MSDKMKTFDDLKFIPFPDGSDMIQARIAFDNGYGISVIAGYCAYNDNENLYEVAIIKDGELCYDLPIAFDVLDNLNNNQITDIMIHLQEI